MLLATVQCCQSATTLLVNLVRGSASATQAVASSISYTIRFTLSQLNSVLTWHDQAGPVVEAFVHIYHALGLFLKGTFGGVNIGSNKMYDEDTAVAMAPDPYSKTIYLTNNSQDNYGTLDFGYTFLQASNWNLGGFIGYGYYKQRLNAYGCEQVATGPICVPTGLVNPSALILSHTEEWDTLRLGLTGNVTLRECLNLSGEAAWHAYSSLSAKDSHWFRPETNPLFERGRSSKGYQLESTLSYLVTGKLVQVCDICHSRQMAARNFHLLVCRGQGKYMSPLASQALFRLHIVSEPVGTRAYGVHIL